jgi:hypothetical protein
MTAKKPKKRFMESAPMWAVLLYTVAVFVVTVTIVFAPGVLTIPIGGQVTKAEAEQAYIAAKEMWVEFDMDSSPVITALAGFMARFNLWTRNSYFIQYELSHMYTLFDMVDGAGIIIDAREVYTDDDERYRYLTAEFRTLSERPLTAYNDASLAFDFNVLRKIENAQSDESEALSPDSFSAKLNLLLFKYKSDHILLVRIVVQLILFYFIGRLPSPFWDRVFLWLAWRRRKWLL